MFSILVNSLTLFTPFPLTSVNGAIIILSVQIIIAKTLIVANSFADFLFFMTIPPFVYTF